MKKLGKCARCGRSLKTVFLIDGVEYGPVCVRKMGGATPLPTASRTRKVKLEKAYDQLTFEDIDDTISQG